MRLWRYLPPFAGLVGVILGLTGCGGGLIDPSPPASGITVGSSAGAYTATVPAPVDGIGVCIDPTLSSVPGFSRSALRLVRGIVGTWASPPPHNLSAGAPFQPGLNLEIRQVATNSYATTNPYTMVQIVGVPGLKPRPGPTSDGFLADDPAWQHAAARVTAKAVAARRQARAGATQVGAIPLNDKPGVYSEIAGCVTALGQTLPTGSSRRIVLFSDLEQNEPPEAGHYLARTRLLIVQACDSGNAAGCAALQQKWRRWLGAEGATSVQFVRPEQAQSAVPAFVKEVPTA